MSKHPNITGRVSVMAFTPNGLRLVVADDRANVGVWDAVTVKPINYTLPGAFRGHAAAITALAFSPDASRVATGSDDKHVMLWCALTGARLSEYVVAARVSLDDTCACGCECACARVPRRKG